MLNGLIGKKLGMTQLFQQDGTVLIGTILEVGPCHIVQKKTEKTDGYISVQVGYEESKSQRVSKPLAGHFKKAGVPPLKHTKEFAMKSKDEDVELGDKIDVGIFKEGDIVDITGTSKGKGFSGTIKRHGFSGQPKSHGGMAHRRPGSIGQASYPSRVWKGMKMAGHMGSVKKTAQGIRVIKIDIDNNIMIVKGSVPGPNGGLIKVKFTTKGSGVSATS